MAIPGTQTNTAATIIGLQQNQEARKARQAASRAQRRRAIFDALGLAQEGFLGSAQIASQILDANARQRYAEQNFALQNAGNATALQALKAKLLEVDIAQKQRDLDLSTPEGQLREAQKAAAIAAGLSGAINLEDPTELAIGGALADALEKTGLQTVQGVFSGSPADRTTNVGRILSVVKPEEQEPIMRILLQSYGPEALTQGDEGLLSFLDDLQATANKLFTGSPVSAADQRTIDLANRVGFNRPELPPSLLQKGPGGTVLDPLLDRKNFLQVGPGGAVPRDPLAGFVDDEVAGFDRAEALLRALGNRGFSEEAVPRVGPQLSRQAEGPSPLPAPFGPEEPPFPPGTLPRAPDALFEGPVDLRQFGPEIQQPAPPPGHIFGPRAEPPLSRSTPASRAFRNVRRQITDPRGVNYDPGAIIQAIYELFAPQALRGVRQR